MADATADKYLRITLSIITALCTILFGILGYLYQEQNRKIEKIEQRILNADAAFNEYKEDHEADKNRHLIMIKEDLTAIKTILGIKDENTSKNGC